MTYIPSTAGVRAALLGLKVDRATATLPQTGTGNIFTVTGGRIILTSLVGEVTVITGGVATTLQVASLPTVGVSTPLCIATGSTISGRAVGTRITLPAAATSALVFDDAGSAGGALVVAPTEWLIPAGALTITTSASDTGSVKWSMTYIPYDDSALVVAA